MTSSHHCTRCHPTEHGWTHKLFCVTQSIEGDDDNEYLVRARSWKEALGLYMQAQLDIANVGEPSEEDRDLSWARIYKEIKYMFELPTAPGPVGVLSWHGEKEMEPKKVWLPEEPPPRPRDPVFT